jgi:hypothetical protein
MNVNIQDLPPSVIATYEATAQARGISLNAFLREYLIENAPSSPPAQMSADEWGKALDECFDAFPATGPITPSAAKTSTAAKTSGRRWIVSSIQDPFRAGIPALGGEANVDRIMGGRCSRRGSNAACD